MARSRAPRSRSRQTTPQSPPRSVSNASLPPSRRSTRSRSHDFVPSSTHQKQKQALLSAVDEESSSAGEIEVIQTNPPSASSQDERDSDVRDGSIDYESESTSSNGATQLEALDADLIIDSLPGLFQASTQILSLMNPQNTVNIIEDLDSPVSKISKRLRNLVTVFNASRDAYGSGSYLDIPIILRKLSGETGLSDGPWRPDPILQLANLSLLLANLLQKDNMIVYDTLDRMFNTFPEPFGLIQTGHGRTRYNTKLVSETVAFGISLRTQFFLKVVAMNRMSPAFDPDAILRQVFFRDDNKLAVNGFQVEGGDLSPEAENGILRRILSIREHFGKSSADPIDLTRLGNRYPWKKFLTEALTWASRRRQEIEIQIASQGTVEAIKERLERGDMSPYNTDTPPAPTNLPTAAPIPKVSAGTSDAVAKSNELPKANMSSRYAMIKRANQLKKIIAQDEEDSSEDEESPTEKNDRTPIMPSGTIGDSPARRPRIDATEIPQSPKTAPDKLDKDFTAHQFDSADDQEGESERDEHLNSTAPPVSTQVSIEPTEQTRLVLQVAREQEVLSNKENINTNRRLFTDKQASAKRLAWEDTQAGQRRNRQKSQHEEEESDEFEVDTRPQKRRRRPRPLPTEAVDDWVEANDEDEVEQQASQQLQRDSPHTKIPSSHLPPSTQPHPQRFPLVDRTDIASERPPSSSAPQGHQHRSKSPPPRPRHQSVSASPSSQQAPASTAQTHKEVNAIAKATMRMRPIMDPAHAAHRVQVRRAWTVEETERLFDMIAIHGCAWATILTEDADHADGPELQQRTQVQLKDKARNLKMDFLKASAELPEGFVAVSIKASDKELLRSLGLAFE